MAGPEQFSKPVSDFCNAWANFGSIVGLLVSVVGFVVTIVTVLKAKGAAELATAAAKEAKEKIFKHETLTNCSSAIAVMEEIIQLTRRKDWEIVLERQPLLRRMLVELKDGGGGLTSQQQTDIQGAIQQFKTIEKTLDGHVSGGKPEPSVGRIIGVISDQTVKLQEIAVSLKTR